MGPTACGKTGMADELVQRFPFAIINVDSVQVYRGMDIGTAKPSLAEQQSHPHHLIDIIDPAQAYSAAEFREDALRIMADIQARGKLPILTGGTMMYFKVLLQGISDLPEANAAIRAEIEHQAAEHGWAHVHAQLAAVDPVSAERIHPNDPQRLQRALEVYRVSGVNMTESCFRVASEGSSIDSPIETLASGCDSNTMLKASVSPSSLTFRQQIGLIHTPGPSLFKL